MKRQLLAIGVGITMIHFAGNLAFGGTSDSTSAKAKVNVKKSIKITKVSDMEFPQAYTGDAAASLDPSSGEGAEFTVSGQKNQSYSISIPSSATMVTGDGVGDDKQIAVSSFASNPNASGDLGNSGSQSLRVGATRAAIRDTQEPGDYEVSFNVTVAY